MQATCALRQSDQLRHAFGRIKDVRDVPVEQLQHVLLTIKRKVEVVQFVVWHAVNHGKRGCDNRAYGNAFRAATAITGYASVHINKHVARFFAAYGTASKVQAKTRQFQKPGHKARGDDKRLSAVGKCFESAQRFHKQHRVGPVSYTHLTLPTTERV